MVWCRLYHKSKKTKPTVITTVMDSETEGGESLCKAQSLGAFHRRTNSAREHGIIIDINNGDLELPRSAGDGRLISCVFPFLAGQPHLSSAPVSTRLSCLQ